MATIDRVEQLHKKETFLAKGLELSKWAFIALTAVAVAIALIVLINQNQTLIDIATTNRENGRILVDCTTPGRECFENGREGQSGAVNDINRITLLAAFCADQDGVQTVEQIETCIRERL